MSAFFAVYVEHWANWWPQLVPAIWNTILLTVFSFLLAVVIGVVLALGKLSHLKSLRGFCIGYIEVTRGIPSLALLFLIYYGLVPLGLVVDAFVAGFVGLGMSAGGYLAEIFRSGIQAVHRGNPYFSSSIGDGDLTDYLWQLKSNAGRVGYDLLTAREREVLQLIAEGSSNQQIAEELFISVKTVEAHRAHIMTKLHAKNRTDLIRYAIRKGLVGLDNVPIEAATD